MFGRNNWLRWAGLEFETDCEGTDTVAFTGKFALAFGRFFIDHACSGGRHVFFLPFGPLWRL